MSEHEDLKIYAKGYHAGYAEAEARVGRILENLGMYDEDHAGGQYAYIQDIKDYIEDRDNK